MLQQPGRRQPPAHTDLRELSDSKAAPASHARTQAGLVPSWSRGRLRWTRTGWRRWWRIQSSAPAPASSASERKGGEGWKAAGHVGGLLAGRALLARGCAPLRGAAALGACAGGGVWRAQRSRQAEPPAPFAQCAQRALFRIHSARLCQLALPCAAGLGPAQPSAPAASCPAATAWW